LYKFIRSNEDEFSSQLLCRVLRVSRSSYYAWRKGQTHQPNQQCMKMEHQIINTFWEHKRRYGSRRISKALQSCGQAVSRYKAGMVLRSNGLKAIQPRSFVPKTTDSRHTYAISPNLILDKALPQDPNKVWVGDITYIPLAGGNWCYLSAWMDLYSRRIIGWHLDDNMKEELNCLSLSKALISRQISTELILHSDRGGQYAGRKFRKIIRDHRITQSMSRADNPYDNAFMESCFSRFKAELLQNGIFETLEDARTEIFEYIEMYYNTIRLHSALNYQSPLTYENQYEKQRIFEAHKQG